MADEMLKVLLCPPGSKPELFEVKNDTAAIEEVLQGPIGIKYLEADGLCLLFNDLGDKLALDINRVVQQDPIFGSCIFCRKQGDTLQSLTVEEITDLEHLLA